MKKHTPHQKRALPSSRSHHAPPGIAAASPAPLHEGARGVIELTEHSLAASIDGRPFAVIDFWTPLSAPSRDFAAAFAAAAARNPDILFARVNAQEQRAIVAQFNIRSIPTLMILRSNIIVRVHAGPLTPAALDEVLGAARALDMEQVRRQVVSVDAVALDEAAAKAPPENAQTEAEARQLSLETCLRPSVRARLTEAASRMASGRLIAIPDAFERDFAERMYRSLDTCRAWRLHEGHEADFHFHHHNLYDQAEFPEDLAECARIFGSPGTQAWVARLSGRRCPGAAEFSASLYLPGDHSLPHNDVATSDEGFHRQVAYVWHLAKDWRSEWGGALYWCSKASYLPPSFNTLYLFNVGPDSNHFVTGVSPYAQGKRLSINGWWTGPEATRGGARKGANRIDANGLEIAIY